MRHIHTIENHLALKKEGNFDTCYNMMNLEDIILNEINQSEEDMLYDSTYLSCLE